MNPNVTQMSEGRARREERVRTARRLVAVESEPQPAPSPRGGRMWINGVEIGGDDRFRELGLRYD